MKIELIKDENKNTTGYKLIPETKSEKYQINEIRNWYFFHTVKYDGREGGCSEFAGSLRFKFKKLELSEI
jgi:hypothetical protein|tara:strand:+ start:1037 stop:1246 length:210 start_codon:yes stop_codon:yes gene_type:complete